VRIRLLPIEACQKAVEVICPIIIRSISIAQFVKVSDYIETEMTRQISADLAAAVGQPLRKFLSLVEKQVSRCLYGIARQH
jgi:hypothetical protein